MLVLRLRNKKNKNTHKFSMKEIQIQFTPMKIERTNVTAYFCQEKPEMNCVDIYLCAYVMKRKL